MRTPAQLGLRACPARGGRGLAARPTGDERRSSYPYPLRLRRNPPAAAETCRHARYAVARQRPHRRRQRALRRRAVWLRHDATALDLDLAVDAGAGPLQAKAASWRGEKWRSTPPCPRARPGRGAQGQAFAQLAGQPIEASYEGTLVRLGSPTTATSASSLPPCWRLAIGPATSRSPQGAMPERSPCRAR
jgi:hypothetical protein